MTKQRENTTPQQSPYIPFIKITPSYICAYTQYVGTKHNVWQKNIFKTLAETTTRQSEIKEQKRYTGEITKSSRKKLQSACDILFALAKKKRVQIPGTDKSFEYRIGLITLTLSAPQGRISDREIKEKLLEPFLRHFRKKGMFNYIWKAERQKNGNLHFHILTDTFIDKDHCRNYWNKLQSKLGFIDVFYSRHGHRNPNSTDTKAVKEEKGMVNYMLKYMLKEVEKGKSLEIGRDISEKATGKIWDCSLNLKMKNDTADVGEDWQFDLLTQEEEKNNLRKIQTDHCVLWFPVKSKIWKASPSFIAKRLTDFLAKVREKGREPVNPQKRLKPD